MLPGPFYDCLRIGLHQSRLSLTEAISYTLPVPRFLYVVVTVKSIPGTLRVVKRFGMKNFQRFFCLYGFTPNARGRHSEPLRPEWRDVEPLIAKLDAIPETCNWRRFWHELPQKHTESRYVEQALSGTWPDEDKAQYEEAHRNMVSLVCRPNLDVYYGFAGQYTNHYGNLRRDGVDEVLSCAMSAGTFSNDEVWFGDMQIPPIEELATRFGDAGSQRIHDSFSIRDWWIDSARRADRQRR